MTPNSSLDPSEAEMVARVRASFGRQQMMRTIGATLETVGPGRVDIGLPFRAELTQQHGYLHAGVVATIADSACGYAAYSLMAGRWFGAHGGIQDQFARAGAR